MANNINLYRGGTPVVRFMWNDKDFPQYQPPFSQNHQGTQSPLFADDVPMEETPPYDSHADGAYNAGNFVLGMPIAPRVRGNIAQRKALQAYNIEIGDIMQCMWLPEDHIATFLNLKSITLDSKMAGATIALCVQNAVPDENGDFTYTEDTDFDAAVTAQVGANSFNVAEPFNAFVSLFKTKDDYAVPMYSSPALPAKDSSSSVTFPAYKVFGIKVLSLPTDNTVTFADMMKAIYLSVRMEAFECPSAL